MSRSHGSLSNSWLHVLHMLDKAAWALAQRRVDFASLVEKNEIIDQSLHNRGVEYTEYVFEVFSYLPVFGVCFVRIWLRKKSNIPRVEKVMVTSRKAQVLGEWDGTKGKETKERSFELFLAEITRVTLLCLYELILTQPPLDPYRKHSVQLSWMSHDLTIVRQDGDVIVLQALDTNLQRPVAEIELHSSNGHYQVEKITLYESLSIEVTSRTFHCSENLWANDPSN